MAAGVTIRLDAIVICDLCDHHLTIGGDNLRARNAWLIARGNGWQHRGGHDLCPQCIRQINHPQGTLELALP
jgi:hypothetical protein